MAVADRPLASGVAFSWAPFVNSWEVWLVLSGSFLHPMWTDVALLWVVCSCGLLFPRGPSRSPPGANVRCPGTWGVCPFLPLVFWVAVRPWPHAPCGGSKKHVSSRFFGDTHCPPRCSPVAFPIPEGARDSGKTAASREPTSLCGMSHCPRCRVWLVWGTGCACMSCACDKGVDLCGCVCGSRTWGAGGLPVPIKGVPGIFRLLSPPDPRALAPRSTGSQYAVTCMSLSFCIDEGCLGATLGASGGQRWACSVSRASWRWLRDSVGLIPPRGAVSTRPLTWALILASASQAPSKQGRWFMPHFPDDRREAQGGRVL